VTRRTTSAIVASGLVAAAIAVAGLSKLSARTDVPLYEVRPGRFVRRISAEGTLKAVQATPLGAPVEAQEALKIGWLLPDGSSVNKGDVLVRFDPTDFENKLREGRGDEATARNKIEKSDAQSTATRENLRRDAEQARRELEAARTFQKKDAEIFSRSQIIEAEVDETLAAKKRDYSESVRAVRERLARAERGLLAIDERKARLTIQRAEQGLGALELKAPHDGILVYRRDWRGEMPRVGDTVWSGQLLGEIPGLDRMQADIFVLEADAGGLAVGQSATVTVESNPDRVVGARVSRVDAVAKPRVRNVPVQYFGVTLALERTDTAFMKPGARVRAELESAGRDNALSVPLQAIFENDGKPVVHRWRRGRFEAVEVALGPASLGRIVVEKGLAAGDRVALADPARPRGERPAGAAGARAAPEAGPAGAR
jgi:multidrug resistance efflux pump